MHKTLPTLGNEKEQKQIKFYKKLSGEFIFSRATRNLKIIYFTHPTGQVLKKLNHCSPISIHHPNFTPIQILKLKTLKLLLKYIVYLSF